VRAALTMAASFVVGLVMAAMGAPSWPTMLVAFAGGVVVARFAEVAIPADARRRASLSSACACGVEHPCPIHDLLERRDGVGLAGARGVELRAGCAPWRSYRCPIHGAFERGIELDAKGDPPAEVACASLRGSAGYTTWPCGESSPLIIAAPPAAYVGSAPASTVDPGDGDSGAAAHERLDGVSVVRKGAARDQGLTDLATVEQVSWSVASPTLAVYSERELTPHEELTPREQAERVVLGAMIARPWLLDRSFIGTPSAEDMINETHRDVARAIHRVWLGGGSLPADPLGMAHAVCVHLTGRPAGVYLFFLWGLVEESIQVIGTPATDDQARAQFDGAVEWLREIARTA
jgi:hypothetical protein